jgi:anti-anti-sigma factor
MSARGPAAGDTDGRRAVRRRSLFRTAAAAHRERPAAPGRRSSPSTGGARSDAAELTGLVVVQQEAGGHVLHLTGDVDAPVLSQLAGEYAVDDLHIHAVDVGALGFIDSTALAFLVRWAHTARGDGRPAEIRGGTPRFERVLEVCGLAPLFDLA